MTDVFCGHRGPRAVQLLIDSGPILTVDVGYDPSFSPDNPSAELRLEGLGLRALIDTGASRSCIDAQLAATLQLPIVDQRLMSGVGGVASFNSHVAQIRAGALKFVLVGRFAGVHLGAGLQRADVLLGRDWLAHFRLSYNGATGAVTVRDPMAPLAHQAPSDDE